MRCLLTFDCLGSRLHATVDEAIGATGLLIVSGGSEIRVGAHRGMAKLAADIAAMGHPVFRFDRRGIGDSEGVNGGFESSAADIEAALAAFREHCPSLSRIVAFGNCDAASALVLHQPAGLSNVILANPWVVEAEAGLPPPAAVKAHYRDRLKSPRAVLRLLSGGVDLRKLARGLIGLGKPEIASPLTRRVADGMTSFPGRVTVVLAARDGTARAFAAEWDKRSFINPRSRGDIALVRLDSASHSFASDDDYAALKSEILDALAQ